MFPEGEPGNLETLEVFPHEIVDEPTLWVPLADGTRLAARLSIDTGGPKNCRPGPAKSFIG